MPCKVLENEDEWGVTYDQVLAYLKASYPKMVSNLRLLQAKTKCAYNTIPCRCYGIKLTNLGYIDKLAKYLEEDCKVIILWL